ncbi:MAG: hypothetical protein ACE5R6_14015 [Candidatus Heimdallarchaeota archaeon]
MQDQNDRFPPGTVEVVQQKIGSGSDNGTRKKGDKLKDKMI